MNIIYCRLEIFSHYHYLIYEKEQAKKELSILFKPEQSYVEKYQDIDSLKRRIKQLIKRYLEHLSEKERAKKLEKTFVKDNKLNKYPAFFIYNREKKWRYIGYSNNKWYFSTSFIGFVAKYLKKMYGEDDYFKYLQAIPREQFVFYTPEHTGVDELDLISEELLDMHLKEFLNGKEISKEDREAAFYKELMSRNYPLSNLEELVSNPKAFEDNEEAIDIYLKEFYNKEK